MDGQQPNFNAGYYHQFSLQPQPQQQQQSPPLQTISQNQPSQLPLQNDQFFQMQQNNQFHNMMHQPLLTPTLPQSQLPLPQQPVPQFQHQFIQTSPLMFADLSSFPLYQQYEIPLGGQYYQQQQQQQPQPQQPQIRLDHQFFPQHLVNPNDPFEELQMQQLHQQLQQLQPIQMHQSIPQQSQTPPHIFVSEPANHNAAAFGSTSSSTSANEVSDDDLIIVDPKMSQLSSSEIQSKLAKKKSQTQAKLNITEQGSISLAQPQSLITISSGSSSSSTEVKKLPSNGVDGLKELKELKELSNAKMLRESQSAVDQKIAKDLKDKDVKEADPKVLKVSKVSKESKDSKKRPLNSKNEPASVSSSSQLKKKLKTALSLSTSKSTADEQLDKVLTKFQNAFEKKQDVLEAFTTLIKQNVKNYRNNYAKLSERLTKIFFVIPESVYHDGGVDYRYKGWRLLILALDDKTFWSFSSIHVKKFFLRVRNWLSHDLKSKDYAGVENSLSIMKEVRLSKDSLETYKIWEVLVKLKKLEKFPNIIRLANSLMGVVEKSKSAESGSGSKATTSSVIKSLSNSKSSDKPVKPISKSKIFINDPHKNKFDPAKDKTSNGSNEKEAGELVPSKPLKKVWVLSDYLKESTQKQPSESTPAPSDEPEADENQRELLENGLFSILRRKTSNDEPKKRRKLSARGVRFKDEDLVSVKLIPSSSSERSSSVELSDSSSSSIDLINGKEGNALLGVTEDETLEWSTPVLYEVSSLPWFNLDLFIDNPVSRGGSNPIESEDRDAQDARVLQIPETVYDSIGKIPHSPAEPSSLNILPPRIEEALMVPFGSAGR